MPAFFSLLAICCIIQRKTPRDGNPKVWKPHSHGIWVTWEECITCKKPVRDFPGSPVVWGPMQGLRVRSLVGELRSHRPHSQRIRTYNGRNNTNKFSKKVVHMGEKAYKKIKTYKSLKKVECKWKPHLNNEEPYIYIVSSLSKHFHLMILHLLPLKSLWGVDSYY